MTDQTEITGIPEDPGDPSDWDEWPDGYGAIIATELEDSGWHIDGHDDRTTVSVIAVDGTDTGVWFARGRCWTGCGDGHGTCRNPIDILADLTDPEEIAGRADTVMRELGLRPGKPTKRRCTDGCMDDDTLPHDGYMESVAEALEARGVKPSSYWTETPDGERLDGVLNFDNHPGIDREWPEGICLTWDQQRGWNFIVGRENRWLDPLPVGTYAHPQAVASASFHRLRGAKAPEADDSWDGAAALLSAVEAWEAEGAAP